MMKDQIKKNCIYIFVVLNADTMSMPDYYICTSNEARLAIDQYSTRGIVTVGKMKKLNYKDQWKKLMSGAKKIEKLK